MEYAKNSPISPVVADMLFLVMLKGSCPCFLFPGIVLLTTENIFHYVHEQCSGNE